jgi:hypothetical protein
LFLLACRGGEEEPAPASGRATERIAAKAARDPERHYEAEAGFSIIPPNGWERSTVQGARFKVFSGPPGDGLAPTIRVDDDEGFTGPLDRYVAGNLGLMAKAFPGFQKLSQEDFQLDSGARAVKVVTTSHQLGPVLRQTFYFTLGEGKAYVVTCTEKPGGADYSTVFDASVKSLRLES